MNLILAFVLAASVWPSEMLLEAENAELVGVTVATTRAGFTGAGYVTGFDEAGDSLRFHFQAEESGIYELKLGVAQSARIVQSTFWIDGVAYTGTLTGTGQAFAERSLREHWLSEGSHTIVVKGAFDVDYLKLVPVNYDPPSTPPGELTDPLATPSARALFSFLREQYGKKILAGQQELRELDYIRATTGKEPAVAGGDLIVYSPSRWERNERPNKATGYASVENLIDWAKQDGIVSLAWHWNAPKDFVDDSRWWSGFYTEWTTFDFAAALADTASEDYRLLLRDIDAIAVQLQKLEDADVPVLWRPLHEAAGGWFWWGSKGPEPYKELWRLLYDRLVNHHGLHNLIWVYTHEPNAVAWYPSDEFVDIVSRDAYPSDPNALLRGDWQELMDLYGDAKMIALSESGVLPDPAASTDYGVWWSWFSMWNDWPGGADDYIRGVPRDYLTQVFTSDVVLTRDELPLWRGLAQDAEVADLAGSTELEVYPNPATGPVTVRLSLPAPANVRIELFDLLGRQVHSENLGTHPIGVLETRIGLNVAPGVYLVRATTGNRVSHQSIVVL